MSDVSGKAEVGCPVGGCPWKYVMTDPTTEQRGGRLVLVVPPPMGVTPQELAAGVAAGQRALDGVLAVLGSGDPPSEVTRVGELVFQAAYAQDEAVMTAHLLGGHTRDELATVLPPDAMRQLDELAS